MRASSIPSRVRHRLRRAAALRHRLPRRRGSRYVLHARWRTLDALSAGLRWPDGLLRLDLGSGFVKPEGFVGIDDLSGEGSQIASEENAPDLFMNLNHDRIPFADDSCDEIRASHFLEHSNLPHVFDEVFRLLRPGGTFLFVVPYANSAEGMFPGHSIFLTERWFALNLHFQRLFETVEVEYHPTELWEELPECVRELLPFEQARQVLFNVCNEMMMWATPRKSERALSA